MSNIDDSELGDGVGIEVEFTSEAKTTQMSFHLLLLMLQRRRIEALGVINGMKTRIYYQEAMHLASQVGSARATASKVFNKRPVDLCIYAYLQIHVLVLLRPSGAGIT